MDDSYFRLTICPAPPGSIRSIKSAPIRRSGSSPSPSYTATWAALPESARQELSTGWCASRSSLGAPRPASQRFSLSLSLTRRANPPVASFLSRRSIADSKCEDHRGNTLRGQKQCPSGLLFAAPHALSGTCGNPQGSRNWNANTNICMHCNLQILLTELYSP